MMFRGAQLYNMLMNISMKEQASQARDDLLQIKERVSKIHVYPVPKGFLYSQGTVLLA